MIGMLLRWPIYHSHLSLNQSMVANAIERVECVFNAHCDYNPHSAHSIYCVARYILYRMI